MEIKKIKIYPALTAKEDDSVKDISNKLRENKERRIFIIDDAGVLKGIITTTDLVYKVLCNNSQEMKAKDIMVREVKSVDMSEDLSKALDIMNSLQSFNCPVVENGKLVGLISYHDLVGHVLTKSMD